MIMPSTTIGTEQGEGEGGGGRGSLEHLNISTDENLLFIVKGTCRANTDSHKHNTQSQPLRCNIIPMHTCTNTERMLSCDLMCTIVKSYSGAYLHMYVHTYLHPYHTYLVSRCIQIVSCAHQGQEVKGD